MDEKHFKQLEEAAADEIEKAINDLVNIEKSIQPPTSVIRLAAEAAAKVLVGFEHGYRLGD